jgi:16S rRNA G1207 methylase RsmC
VNTSCELAGRQYALYRFPKGQHDKTLQAWDSSDELAVSYYEDNYNDSEQKLVVINDQFGAISVGLHSHKPILVTDSKIAELATHQNYQENNLEPIDVIPSTSALPSSDVYIIKLSKTLALIESQLAAISQVAPNAKIIATGKTQLITSNLLKMFERYFTVVTTSLAKKKSRLIFAESVNPKFDAQYESVKTVSWPEKHLNLSALPNVFSREQIDIGGRFMADNLPGLKNGDHIIDLGCGNGLLGVCAIQLAQKTQNDVNVIFADESYMAIESAKLNVKQNLAPSPQDSVEYIVADCLTGVDDNSADIVLCNPPFHQQNTLTEHIAEQMFVDAHRCLKQNGRLYVVANRHLKYQTYFKRIFGGFKVHNQNRKFIIYQCNK